MRRNCGSPAAQRDGNLYGASLKQQEQPMSDIQFLNPEILGKPIAPYSNIARVKASEFLFVAGQVAMDKDGKVPAEFEAQCAQVFANIGAALASQGASFANVLQFTSYLVHSQDIARFAQFRAREFPRLFAGGAYPPNTLLVVDRLVREEFLLEVTAVAAL
jgi:enamine deaminase RidA (YjgF/YER057c/UK114 family)